MFVSRLILVGVVLLTLLVFALGADGFFVKPFHLTPFMQLGALIKDVAFGQAAGE